MGAPADDDHVPPGVATVTPWPGLSRRGPARVRPARVRPARVLEPEWADARLRPDEPMGAVGADGAANSATDQVCADSAEHKSAEKAETLDESQGSVRTSRLTMLMMSNNILRREIK